MSLAGKNLQSAWNNTIDQPILFVNSSAPKPAELALERLRLPNALNMRLIRFSVFLSSDCQPT